jgi:L-threonylcarbamoyladenylate synthase
MPILPPDAAGIASAVAALRAGGVVGLPTETVYGLAADARRADAIMSVFEAKARPLFDPLIVHLPEGAPDEVLRGWATPEAIARAAPFLASFWPGPLTVVLERAPGVLDLLTSGLPTVALRMPRHPVALALLAQTGPLVAPSANRFGRISPTTAAAVRDELGDVLVLDGGPCEVGVESTVVYLPVRGPATLLRPGGTPSERLVAALGPMVAAGDPGSRPASPGQLASHYAPRTQLVLVRDPTDPAVAGAGVLAFGVGAWPGAAKVIDLGADPRVAAQGLFAALRELDAAGLPRLVAQVFPSAEGLGAAIQDRLRRASAPLG